VEIELHLPQAHLRQNLLAAVAAARAVGVTPAGPIELELSSGRGQTRERPDGTLVIDDSYNANPMSMAAALQELHRAHDGRDGAGRAVAVLGDMLELGPEERRYHEELGEQAQTAGVGLLITVGPLAAAAAEHFDGECQPVADAGEAAAVAGELIAPGDTVLVKGSRGVGLEAVVEALTGADV
jgi:UDP-N-acetylmuramyl pentapeptide synthase